MQMKKLKGAIRSRMMWFAGALAALAPVEASFGLLKDALGGNYGWSYLAIAAAVGGLRWITTEALADK